MLNSNIWIFIIVFIIIVILAWYHYPRKNYNKVPKIIWSYWDNPDKIPKTVKMCMESWKKYNPDYEIILLNKKTYKGYVNIPVDIANHYNYHDTDARFSDLIRLYALAEHGGVWIDSTILLNKPLDDWLFPKYGEFAGFYLGSFSKLDFSPVIESWFLACNKGSSFMKLWKEEFVNIANYVNVEAYIDSRRKMGINFQNMNDPIYLAIQIAAQKVLQIDRYPTDQLILQKAEDGPFRYLVDAKWDSEKALLLACSNKKYQGPIMKMREVERKVMEEKFDFELSNDKCGWIN